MALVSGGQVHMLHVPHCFSFWQIIWLELCRRQLYLIVLAKVNWNDLRAVSDTCSFSAYSGSRLQGENTACKTFSLQRPANHKTAGCSFSTTESCIVRSSVFHPDRYRASVYSLPFLVNLTKFRLAVCNRVQIFPNTSPFSLTWRIWDDITVCYGQKGLRESKIPPIIP